LTIIKRGITIKEDNKIQKIEINRMDTMDYKRNKGGSTPG
jgi:hypothetical protein